MRLRALRPVGEPLPAPRAALDARDLVPDGYEIVFTQSGTAALALALCLAAERAADARRRRVLLPAYGCPDLVAAVRFAGLEPEFVDTAADSPFLSQQALRIALGEDVVAVVGAHFLGLAEDISALQSLCAGHGVTVIEDSAQKVPCAGGIDARADLVVMSFGRGKPAGALGGGALLLRTGLFDPTLAERHVGDSPPGKASAGWRRLAYNMAIRPGPFALVSRLPGLDLGLTRYRPLEVIRTAGEGLRRHALSGWSGARRHPRPVQAFYTRALAGLAGVRPLPAVAAQPTVPLGRYPVLAGSAAQRDALCGRLRAEGLGSSAMYGAALSAIDGVPVPGHPDLDNAMDFAARLLTLPTHSDVSEHEAARIIEIVGGSA